MADIRPMPEPNSFEDFHRRFQALAMEAHGYGVTSLVVLLDDDMLKEEESQVVLWTKGHMVAVGMAEYAKHHLLFG